MELKICSCVGVNAGDYTNQVTVVIPDHMSKYARARVDSGLSNTICIDTCIVEEIKYLWGLGITTYGCCCGHNKQQSFVNVDVKDIHLMLELGYVQNHPNKDRKDTFRLKSAG